MLTQIFILLCSLFLVVFCANYLVEGASVVARKLGVSEFLIGMLIIGFGTSLPELVVSLVGAVNHNADVAVGNIVGSNIFNTSFILGLSALIASIAVTTVNAKRDIPFLLMATALFVLFGVSNGGVSRWESLILLAFFAMYLVYIIKTDGETFDPSTVEHPSGLLFESFWGSIILIIGSTIGLIVGGNLFVESSTKFGAMVGLSDKVVAVVILAFGTSLPELATCLAAIKKKRTQMALGDLIGSNLFNMLFVVGLSGVVHPLSFANITIVDLFAFVAVVVMLFATQHTTHQGKITRFDGALMITMFVAYMIMLFQV